MARLNSVRVKASYDQTLTDNDNIESFTPNTGNPKQIWVNRGVGAVYVFVEGEPEYNEGEPVIDPYAGQDHMGFKTVKLVSPQMHVDTYAWLVANYRGQVTAYLRTDGTTYARYNCQLSFSQQSSGRANYPQVTWEFTIIEEL